MKKINENLVIGDIVLSRENFKNSAVFHFYRNPKDKNAVCGYPGNGTWNLKTFLGETEASKKIQVNCPGCEEAVRGEKIATKIGIL